MPTFPSFSTHLFVSSTLATLALIGSGCTVDPEQQAKVDAMVAEQQSEQVLAKQALETARANPNLEHYTALIPLMQRSDLLITFDDVQMNVDSAARKVLREETDLFREALVGKLEALTAGLPTDDSLLAMEQAEELLIYVKLLVDTASEIKLSSGASTVPSVNVFIKAQGENGPTQLTVGYLYPYADVGPASQVVINAETLPPLVEHLSKQIRQGLTTTSSSQAASNTL